GSQLSALGPAPAESRELTAESCFQHGNETAARRTTAEDARARALEGGGGIAHRGAVVDRRRARARERARRARSRRLGRPRARPRRSRRQAAAPQRADLPPPVQAEWLPDDVPRSAGAAD